MSDQSAADRRALDRAAAAAWEAAAYTGNARTLVAAAVIPAALVAMAMMVLSGGWYPSLAWLKSGDANIGTVTAAPPVQAMKPNSCRDFTTTVKTLSGSSVVTGRVCADADGQVALVGTPSDVPATTAP